MKTLLIGLAALCIGTVGLAASSEPGCDSPGGRSSAGSARTAPLGFAAVGSFGRGAVSPI